MKPTPPRRDSRRLQALCATADVSTACCTATGTHPRATSRDGKSFTRVDVSRGARREHAANPMVFQADGVWHCLTTAHPETRVRLSRLRRISHLDRLEDHRRAEPGTPLLRRMPFVSSGKAVLLFARSARKNAQTPSTAKDPRTSGRRTTAPVGTLDVAAPEIVQVDVRTYGISSAQLKASRSRSLWSRRNETAPRASAFVASLRLRRARRRRPGPARIPVGSTRTAAGQWPLSASASARICADLRPQGGNESRTRALPVTRSPMRVQRPLDVQGHGILVSRATHWHGSTWHYEVDGKDHRPGSSLEGPDQARRELVFLPKRVPSPLTYTGRRRRART